MLPFQLATFWYVVEILLTFSYHETESLHFGFSAPKKLTFWYFGQSYQKLTFWYPSRILKRKTYIFVGNRIITCTNQICFIYFLFGSGITGLRPCFQFSKWKKSTKTDPNLTIKSWFILSRLRRIRWASQFFHTEKSEDPQN